MNRDSTQATKKEVMKDIIRGLHQGLSLEEAKERFEREVGSVTSTEIAEIEQALMNEGLSPEEIKKFCNVHALLFQSALEKSASEETFPSHPVYLFKLENREIEKLVDSLRDTVGRIDQSDLASSKETVKELLSRLRGIETHYERKEQLLFPFLEKRGFVGPSKVMWGKDNEIRDLVRAATTDIEGITTREEFEGYAGRAIAPLIEETRGMILKEESILFPASLEKLTASDWASILRESDDVGYVFIEKPKETEALLRDLESAFMDTPVFQEGTIFMPTGAIGLKELMSILNTLPIDLTFVDKDDTVAYFSDGQDRIFRRTKSVIGREVRNCHPPQSVEVVEKILASFKEGTRDSFDFWIDRQGRFIYIRYIAVRDAQGRYLGTLEATMDATRIRELEGEKRLLDETH